MDIQIKNRKLVTLVVCLIPLLWLFLDIAFGNLGSNPIQALHIRLGDWSLRFLCITLAVTPIQMMTRWRGMSDYRQMLGSYAFFYATLHLLAYLVVDNNLMWSIIGTDIIESPYIWFGVVAYLIVFALAITSPKWVMKSMGKSWKKLHRLIYVSSIAAIIHYFWQLKGNLAEPLLYSIIIFFLLLFRVLLWKTRHELKEMMIPKGYE